MLISIEGGEGVGKTTQATLLEQRVRALGRDVVLIREPGGTPLGEQVRDMVKGGVGQSYRSELLLFEAARAELVETVIRPAIERGTIVISDRFADSSLAYQGHGREIPLQVVARLNEFATGGLTPDATILLNAPPSVGAARAAERDRHISDAMTKFEDEPEDFQERVSDGFREIASREPSRWYEVDATPPIDEVADAVWGHIEALLRERDAQD